MVDIWSGVISRSSLVANDSEGLQMMRQSLAMMLMALACLLQSGGAAIAANLVKKPSPHTVATTMDRLENALAAKNISVIARVDHAASAAKVDMTLRPTTLLIFGNPALGTPLMQQNQLVGLSLPMKVLAWRDEGGQVWLAYQHPRAIAAAHGLDPQQDMIEKMAKGLDNLTETAARQ